MATVTKSIGTSSRDYSTITAWEADLDDTNIYTSGDDAVGECYNDSTFTQTDNLIIRSGGVVGLNSVTLTAATTDRHDGTAGTGAEIGVASMKRIYMQAGYNASVSIKNVVSWLDINGQGYGRTSLFTFYTANDELKNCICRSVGDQVTPARNCYNNIIYNGGSFIYNANYGTSSAANVLNNTVYGVNRGITVGIANSNVSIKNNICAGTSIVDFDGNYGDVGYGVPQVSNNLSSDATAPGTNSLINKPAAKQFVSTVSGSEDLHLKSGADAIGAGVDLATSSLDINGSDRNALAATVWDIGAHQFASTASIGSTGRDYSTITLWEADLDDTTIYGAGANAVGECYNDSTFTDNNLTINGGGTVGLNSVTLSVNSASRHDGTAGTGATIQSYAGPGLSISNTTVEYLTISSVGIGNYAHSTGLSHTFNISNTYIRNNIVYGDLAYRNNTSAAGPGISNQGSNCITINNIIYNRENTNPSSVGGIGLYNHYNINKEIYNNTIYRCGVGYSDTRRGTSTSKNNISTGSTRGLDFSLITNYNYTLTASNNLSSDDSADDAGGSGHIINKPASKQFVSTLSGSEDLHLKFISAAIDAGVDLGTSPDGVQYDIDGKDRDAENSIWDIGAHEFGDNVVYGLFTVL
jgi:hypothetical protein